MACWEEAKIFNVSFTVIKPQGARSRSSSPFIEPQDAQLTWLRVKPTPSTRTGRAVWRSAEIVFKVRLTACWLVRVAPRRRNAASVCAAGLVQKKNLY